MIIKFGHYHTPTNERNVYVDVGKWFVVNFFLPYYDNDTKYQKTNENTRVQNENGWNFNLRPEMILITMWQFQPKHRNFGPLSTADGFNEEDEEEKKMEFFVWIQNQYHHFAICTRPQSHCQTNLLLSQLKQFFSRRYVV